MRLTIGLAPDLHQRVRVRAFRDKTSISRVIAYALLAYLEDRDEDQEPA